MMRARVVLPGVVLILATLSAGLQVNYEILSTLYLPYTYEPTATYALDENAAEQMAYDKEAKIIYTVGKTLLHVIDLSDVMNPVIVYNISYHGVEITDVEVCGKYVFVAFDNETVRENGFLNVYRAYNATSESLELLDSVIVGTVPDMVKPTSDCMKILVAIEGEIYEDTASNSLVDNPGGIGVATFTGDPNNTLTYEMVDFTYFDDKYDAQKQSTGRFVYQGNSTHPNLFSNDLEPEYIAFNKDDSIAYITLQENNAIAVFNMSTMAVDWIYGLGYKDWSLYTMDASDRDDAINMQSYPVFGMYQPDAIKFFTHNDVDYVITANEGDAKSGFNEEERIRDLVLSSKFGNATEREHLQQNTVLGRLEVTTENGQNENKTEYDELYAFGARSFSIWRADTLELVYDSGDELERKMADLLPEFFNADVEAQETVAETKDTRSDAKGLEPESLETATFGNYTLLMIGGERPGVVAVYAIDNNNATLAPEFQIFILGITNTTGQWQELYDNRQASMIDPEDIIFVSAEESPNGQDLLLVSGSVSGTVSVVHLNVTLEDGDAPTAGPTTQVPTTTAGDAGSPGDNGPTTVSDGVRIVLSSGLMAMCLATTYMFGIN